MADSSTALTPDLVVRNPRYEGKNYKVWSEKEKIEGFVDSLEALKQAIEKEPSTEQYEYPIYSFRYGIAWKQLIGEERPFVRAELKRMIQEALGKDDRIREVDGFAFTFSGDSCHCSFRVFSIYGDFDMEMEVAV